MLMDMQKSRKKSFKFLAAGICFCMFSLISTNAYTLTDTSQQKSKDSTTYTLDPNHSSVIWQIDHLGFSHYYGKWFVEGSLILDEKNPQNSKVNATIKLDSINTGNPELDKHLKSVSFFDTTKFPLATFTSNKVEVTGNNTANVYGILTFHGTSKPEMLKVVLNKVGDNPITDKPSVGFSATTEIKRSDFGMNTLLPMLGDNVKINIEVEASTDKNKESLIKH